ncbi:hypothetical protein QFC21_006228 [Naganishia friedmannii]|uniref:Uncharacterized protein n=1 Tax=Naganishia friedmannii TaxID=89922 RepID=A0ACC2V4L1_9TREE|nr:hypothetical protein QFC21_006228 [Naganishia friedmannii]
MDTPSRETTRPSTQAVAANDHSTSSSQRLELPSSLGLDPARLAPGRSSHWGYHGDTSPQGTTSFAQTLGYYPSADSGNISPTTIGLRSPTSDRAMPFQLIGEQDVYQGSEGVRPQQAAGHPVNAAEASRDRRESSFGPRDTSHSSTMNPSAIAEGNVQSSAAQRRHVGGFDRTDNTRSAYSVASAPPTTIPGNASTRNNSIATAQTSSSSSSAPVFGGAPGNRRRSSLTQSLALRSLPLPAFGHQTSATGQTASSGSGVAAEQRQSRSHYLDDPLAPLNLSSATHFESGNRVLVFPSHIVNSTGGNVYIAQTPGPSSAPASPGMLQEPSEYIHTHLPRRASLTPANLNLVSPVPPSASVIEQVRRESQLSNMGNPGNSPLLGSSEHFGQMHWGLRRKSLTPSSPSLAMASPTKMTATASISRKSAFGATLASGDMHARSSSAGPGSIPSDRGLRSGTSGLGRRSSTRPATSEGVMTAIGERRRSTPRARTPDPDSPTVNNSGSASASRVPQLGSTGPSLQLPNLEQPSNVSTGPAELSGTAATPIPVVFTPGSAGFKFGESATSGSPSSVTRHSPTSSTNRSPDSTEAAEAERQRIAFMTSSYGHATRGSLGRGGLSTATPGSRRGSALRDQIISASASTPEGKKILLGNEGYRRGSLGIPGFDTSGLAALSTSASTTASGLGSIPPILGAQIGQGSSTPSASSSHDGRRGSIPVTIPERDPRRTPSTASEDIPESEDEDEQEQDFGQQMTESYAAQLVTSDRAQWELQTARPLLHRPLPPLMPLSDPGPRLLPSTLALHRASHLLSSRNLESEPLPHPLPPSLHPPASVSVSDLDLDFILSGAYDPPLIDPTKRNVPSPNTALSQYAMQNRPGVQLGPGGTDEDSFAKFVGAFDEEYDSRRGDWTFRVRPEGKTAGGIEWESPGAGRYMITTAGEVISQRSGKGWRVKRVGNREYRLDRIPEEAVPSSSGDIPSVRPAAYAGNHLVLTSKRVHCNSGGLKIDSSPTSMTATPNDKRVRQLSHESESRQSSQGLRTSETNTSASSTTNLDRATTTTSTGSRRASKSQEKDQSIGASQAIKGLQAKIKEVSGIKDKERDKKKDRASFGDKLKKTWLATVKSSTSGLLTDKAARRAEREREQGQSRSWSGESSKSNWSTSSSGASNRNRAGTAEGIASIPPSESSSGSGLGSLPEAEERSKTPAVIFGKAWETVPEEALAMAVPLTDNGARRVASTRLMPSGQDSSGRAAFLNDSFSRVLMVYIVPFMSSDEPGPSLPAPRLQPERRMSTTQRLLSRHSKEKVPPGPSLAAASPTSERSNSGEVTALDPAASHPLPFRAFRVVAKIVRPRDLKSENMFAESPAQEELPTEGSGETVKQEWSEARDDLAEISPFADFEPSRVRGSDATIIANKQRAGSEFPIIIGVCHSRAQGVEFVLEGLDRLGLCQGQSAWGPTGYEEWRGSGLSAHGWEVLETLWAACVGIMGLQ